MDDTREPLVRVETHTKCHNSSRLPSVEHGRAGTDSKVRLVARVVNRHVNAPS